MSISGITSTANSYATSTTTPWAQAKKDMQALSNALSSGNLTDAQNAFNDLQQSLPGSGAGSQSTGPAGQAIQNIGTALQSGNISAAQQAFAQLQSVGKSVGHGHHHHRGGGAAQSGGSASGTSQSAGSQTDSGTATTYTPNGDSGTVSELVQTVNSSQVSVTV